MKLLITSYAALASAAMATYMPINLTDDDITNDSYDPESLWEGVTLAGFDSADSHVFDFRA